MGCPNCAHYLNWKCGIALGAAREKVRSARALGELGLIREAFRLGRLSYSKVRALTRVASQHNEAALLEIALLLREPARDAHGLFRLALAACEDAIRPWRDRRWLFPEVLT